MCVAGKLALVQAVCVREDSIAREDTDKYC